MFDKVIAFSIKNKVVVGAFTLALMLWGGWSLQQLPIDAVPDITNNQVQVITVSPSLAAQEIERLVTFPVEQTMATIPGIEEIRSFSRFGLSVVTVVFHDNIDVYWARQQVGERLVAAKGQIPKGVGEPEMAPVTTGLGEIYQYVLHPKKGYADKFSPTDLRTIQDWIVRRQLLGTEGVAEVSSFGGFVKQYEIALNPDKLRSMSIGMADIFTALEKNNQNTGGAYIDKKPNAYFIRSEGLIGNLEDIGKIVVRTNPNGIPVLVRDIATVQFGHAVRYGAMTRNDEGEVVGGLVLMLKGANSSKVIGKVKARIAQIEKNLPEGVVVEPFLDRTKLVNHAISTVTTNLAEGALIVVFVLILFLGNLRAGLVVASVIPLAMLFAIAMMHVFGVSGNLMSLGAVDFGLIVDGAVIIVESILHRLAFSQNGVGERISQGEMDGAVKKSASRMMNSAAFGQMIILIVYLPILALVGVEGKMFKPMAQTVSFAILGAFLLSLTYVPMMSALFLSKKTTHKRNFSDRLMEFFHRIYAPAIRFALNRKPLVVLSSLALLALSLAVLLRMGGEFLPTLDEGDFAVETRVLAGSSISQTIQAAMRGAKILKDRFPEVKEVIGKVGSSEIPTDPMPVDACDLMIILKDKKDWTSAGSRDELAKKMAKELEDVPGVTFGFQQPIQMRFNELMTGARQDVIVKIYGEDLDALSDYANKVGKIAGSITGATDLYVEQATGLPQIVVKFDRDRIAQFGLNIEAVNQVIRMGFAGESAGLVFEGEKRFELVVRLAGENRQSIDDLKNLSVTAPNGLAVPLDQLAEISFKSSPNQIQRDDAKRRIIVGFNVRDRDVESIVKELQGRIAREIKFAPGYYPTYGGAFQNLVEARARLAVAVPVALAMIFFLLFFAFNSFKQGMLIFTAIPLSVIGGVFALWLRDMPFSISAGVGFIALFGVAVLNGIVLIAEFKRLELEEKLTDLREIVLRGTHTRLRPVLLTATVASLGFLPMALSNGSGAEVQKPLATVVIGGLISATFLTLLVLPVLFIYFEKLKSKRLKTPVAVLVLLALFSIPTIAGAQTTVSETQAIEKALQNNRSIAVGQYEIDLQRILKKSAVDIPKTDFGILYGQINSLQRDHNFSISQSIPFPAIFQKQKNLADANIAGSATKLAVTRNELTANVRLTYNNAQYSLAQRRLMLRQDSIIGALVKAADLRYRTGESTYLEKVNAESQLAQIRNQLAQNEADIQMARAQLQTLLYTSDHLTLADSLFTRRNLTIPDESQALGRNPELAFLQQQIEIANQQTALEKARQLPDFRIGYFNQSIIGTQTSNGTDVYYDGGKRFQGLELGVGVPIVTRANRARTEAARMNIQIAQTKLEYGQNNLQGQYRQWVQTCQKQQQNLNFYEKTALPQADLMLIQAQTAWKNGDIGYLEFSLHVQRALDIQMDYLGALHDYNSTVIQLQYLVGAP